MVTDHTDQKAMRAAKMLFQLADETISKEDFVAAFRVVLETIAEFKEYNNEELRNFKKKWEELCDKMKGENEENMEGHRQELVVLIDGAMQRAFENLSDRVDAKLETVKDGLDADEEEIIARILEQIPTPEDGKDGSPDTGDEIILKINESEFLIERSRIEGIEEIEQRLAEAESKGGGGIRVGWGAHPLRIMDESTVIDKVARTIKFAGAGVSAARGADGVITVTISGGAGASFSVLTATGTVDDSNTSFTFASEPSLVCINGAFYRDGKGVTISGTSVTTDFPVGTGGDIYGIA